MLLDRGADVNARRTNGWTALFTAVQKHHDDIVEILIGKGADVNAHDTDGWTPLFLASQGCHIKIATMLLERHADVNAATTVRGPLLWGHRPCLIASRRYCPTQGTGARAQRPAAQDYRTPITVAHDTGMRNVLTHAH